MSMVISSGLEIKDPSVVVKYRWLNEKFSPHLAMIKRAAQKMTDHELRETYLSIQNE
jgi:hypothetical protein